MTADIEEMFQQKTKIGTHRDIVELWKPSRYSNRVNSVTGPHWDPSNMSTSKVITGPADYWVPAHLNYGRFLLDSLKAGGDKIALINAETGQSTTYREILQWSVNAAGKLKLMGLRKGDIVGICSENRLEYIISMASSFYCGATVATASISYSEGELNHVLRLSKPKFIFCSSRAIEVHGKALKSHAFIEKFIIFNDFVTGADVKFESLVRNQLNVEHFDPEDVNGKTDSLAILCSSGTTGSPKGVMLSHLNFLLSAVNYTHENLDERGIYNVITFVPWHHAYGFMTTLNYLITGRTIVYLARFQEELFFESIATYKVNLALLVPTVAVIMSKSPLLEKFDMSSLKHLTCGAAVLKVETINAIKKRIPSLASLTQGYGMTETALTVIKDEKYDGSNAGTIGKVIPGVKAKVVDLETRKPLGPNQEGEICVKGALIMNGYIGNTAATAQAYDEEGFLKTGDVGYYTEDKVFHIVDRVKELIKYKGNQVPPSELEDVLQQHPGVVECGVVGAPDELAGELPTAFVVLQPGAKVSEKELFDLVASKLSNAKRLRGGVKFVKELPKNATGKIMRRILREMCIKKNSSKL